jgi:ABC-type phosphate transport system permease subunit
MGNSEAPKVTTNPVWSSIFFHLFFLFAFFTIELTFYPSKSSDGAAAIIAGIIFVGVVAIAISIPIGILILRIAKTTKHRGAAKYFLGLVACVLLGALVCGLAGLFLSHESRFVFQLTLVSSISGSVAGCLNYISCI